MIFSQIKQHIFVSKKARKTCSLPFLIFGGEIIICFTYCKGLVVNVGLENVSIRTIFKIAI